MQKKRHYNVYISQPILVSRIYILRVYVEGGGQKKVLSPVT